MPIYRPPIPLAPAPALPDVTKVYGVDTGTADPRSESKPASVWIWPAEITRISGYKFNPPSHGALDIGTPANSKIFAPSKGTVSKVAFDENGYGLYVGIKTGDGPYVILAHLNKAYVDVGDTVKAGTVIGLSGSTGNSTGPHLHFEIRTSGGGGFVDPYSIYGSSPQPGKLVEWGSGKVTKPGTKTPYGTAPGTKSPYDVTTPGSAKTSNDGPGLKTPLGRFELTGINWQNIAAVLGGLALIFIGVMIFAGGEAMDIVAGRLGSTLSSALKGSGGE